VDLKSFLSTVKKDSLIGLPIPVPVANDGAAVIGYYCPEMGAGHLDLPPGELKLAAQLLYTAKHVRVAAHGLKRMREVYRLPDLALNHERVWDTRLMAHLLDPDRDDDHGYRLSALMREYLDENYPYMGENLFAQDYPEFLHRCVEKDARLVHTLSAVLRNKMDSDLLRLYHEVELPVSSVLVQMHLDGIAVDQAACEKYLLGARQQLAELESQLDLGSRNLFSARDAYWFLRDAGVGFPGDIGLGFSIDDDDPKELAQAHLLQCIAKSYEVSRCY